MESSGNGKANFDDEDPDMDDWSDFGSDDELGEAFDGADESDNDEEIDGMNHEDAFMDADSSGEEENEFVQGINKDSDSDSFDGIGMLNGSDDDEFSDEEAVISAKKSSKVRKRTREETSIYADAEEYEQKINKW